MRERKRQRGDKIERTSFCRDEELEGQLREERTYEVWQQVYRGKFLPYRCLQNTFSCKSCKMQIYVCF